MAYSSLEQEDINLQFWEACKKGDLDAFTTLLPDASLTTTVKGCTPIIAAIQFRKPTIYLTLLSDPRTEINAVCTTSGGHTVLHWAAMCGNIPAIQTIASIPGVDLNIKNIQGETPIMLAVMCKNAVAVEALLELDGVNLDTENNNGVRLECLAKQWMDVTSRKDSAFRRDMSRIIVVLLGRAREGRTRQRRERERREQEAIQDRGRRERMEQEMMEQERMEQERREHREMHERVRSNQERQREREVREHEEMHERIRREIARMELRDSIGSDDDEPAEAVVEIGEEADEYFVVVAGGEREDRVEEVIRDDSDEENVSQTVLKFAGRNKTDGTTICKAEEAKEEATEKVDSGKEIESDGSEDEELKEIVSTISKTVEDKIEEILSRIEKLNCKIMEREKSLKSLDARHEEEKKHLKEKQSLEEGEHYIAFKNEVKAMTQSQEKDLEAIQLLKNERELNHKLHETLHRFEDEEKAMQISQETKIIAMFVKHETETKELKRTHRNEVVKHLEEDEVMKKLKTQKKELNKHLSKLTAKPEILPCPECPVCFDSMKPPTRILQCVNGHLVCVECARKVERFICPTCKQEFSGRATAMEQFLRTLFQHES